MQRKIIPEIVNRQKISSLKGENSVLEAATMMANANIGAVVVVDDDEKLIGIITERDMTLRVVSKALDPKETKIADIMTKNPDTLSPDDSAGDALELMQSRHYRHLPVAEDKSFRFADIFLKRGFRRDVKISDRNHADAFAILGDRGGVASGFLIAAIHMAGLVCLTHTDSQT